MSGQTYHRLMSCLVASAVFLGGCMHGHNTTVVPMSNPNVPSELSKVTLPPYVIEPPDILLIDVYLPPRVQGGQPLLLYPQPIQGLHPVQLDGTIRLGIWGSINVAGLTLDQAADAVRRLVFERSKLEDEKARKNPPKPDPDAKKDDKDATNFQFPPIADPSKLFVVVDVSQFNSKYFYVITDGAGYGEQIYRFSVVGNETVLDALAFINGLPSVGSRKNIWVARRTPHQGQVDQILPVDYIGMTQHGVTATNFQLMPGDRVYVKSERIFRIDSFLQKALTPVERILGVTLLGSSTYNSISGRNIGGGNNGQTIR